MNQNLPYNLSGMSMFSSAHYTLRKEINVNFYLAWVSFLFGVAKWYQDGWEQGPELKRNAVLKIKDLHNPDIR